MSEQAATWMVVGPGNIGTELQRQVGQDYVAKRLQLNQLPDYVVRSGGVVACYNSAPEVSQVEDIPEADFPDVTFLAIPTDDEGFDAKSYLDLAHARGKLAVTAEKGAMANFFGELKERSSNFTDLGVKATVGGGTRMLDVLESYTVDPENVSQIHLALNGTLSAIFSYIAPRDGMGMSLGQAVEQAIVNHYAEPGAANPTDVIKGEAEGDIPKKTAILFNKLGLSEDPIDWTELKFSLSDDQISEATEEAKVRRFIVSLYSQSFLGRSKGHCPEQGIIGAHTFDHEGWQIVSGFRNVERNPLFDPLAKLTGPGAGFVIGLGPNETDGVYEMTGPGAGVKPTVNAMLDDYIQRAHLLG